MHSESQELNRGGADLERVQQAGAAGQLTSSAVENICRWLTEPAFGEYMEPLRRHVAEENWQLLNDLFWEVIPFGTGGRRGRMHPIGTAVINQRTIGESAQGLVDYLRSSGSMRDGRAVVAHDSRHRSREFAKLTAEVFAAAGMKVYFFSGPRSTPQLSFAVRHLQCDAGVVISASHNPPSDNGFKCYWSSGGQVLAPHDRGIIDAVYRVGAIDRVNFDAAVAGGKIEIADALVDQAFVNAVCAESMSGARDAAIMFTPLHGVGETSVFRVLKQAGFARVEILQSQREPDGDFPNVPNQIPNPEVPAALAAAIDEAQRQGIALVLASDPDADRLGAAVQGNDGNWVCLTGNQIAALVADHVLGHLQSSGTISADHYLVKTLVTSELLRRVGEHYGVRTRGDLLVGFKYIAETIDEYGPQHFVFGAEESFGYLKGAYARDKDAAVAALLLSESAAELKLQGKTLLDRLDELYVRDGYHRESATSKVCTGPTGAAQIRRIMDRLRSDPPRRLGEDELDRVFDYGTLEVRRVSDNARVDTLERPEGNLMIFRTTLDKRGSVAFAARPSGTEPKIKFYFFGEASCSSAEHLATVKQHTQQRMDRLQEKLLQWIEETVS